jgi:hypothetical protein
MPRGTRTAASTPAGPRRTGPETEGGSGGERRTLTTGLQGRASRSTGYARCYRCYSSTYKFGDLEILGSPHCKLDPRIVSPRSWPTSPISGGCTASPQSTRMLIRRRRTLARMVSSAGRRQPFATRSGLRIWKPVASCSTSMYVYVLVTTSHSDKEFSTTARGRTDASSLARCSVSRTSSRSPS